MEHPGFFDAFRIKQFALVRIAGPRARSAHFRGRPRVMIAATIAALSLGTTADGLPAAAPGPAAPSKSHGPCVTQTQSFGVGSAWNLCVATVSKFGFIIYDAGYRRSASEHFISVLSDARLGEIFVPYHTGTPRFGDISQFNFAPLVLNANDCPAPGTLIDGNKICRELRDYGLAWKNDSRVLRGKQWVYWAALDASNYNYIIEWSFRDDGAILARAGSTGPKLGGPDDPRGHMHNFTWRLDIDLNGPRGDTAYINKHEENLSVSPSTADDSRSRISNEGARVWTAENFTSLSVFDNRLKNGNSRPTSYEIVPFRSGTARHSEDFMKQDFWVTAYKPDEILANGLTGYIADGQSTENTDIVVWYTTSAHHENDARDEDRQTTPVKWVGFDLMPNNLFDGTPFY